MTSDSGDTSDSDLHTAVRYGDVKGVRKALKCRLSPNKIGIYQWSPLHEAASSGCSDIIRLLLKHGGNPNFPDRLLANTALHYAAQEGHPTCLHLLIEAGGDYSLTNKDGDTPHDLATRACERVIEKKRVEHLIRLPLGEAKSDAEHDFCRIDSAQSVTKQSSEHPLSFLTSATNYGTEAIADNEDNVVSSDILPTRLRAKAWTPQITKPDPGTMGMLHVSFEYNTKKDYLKIRLWKLTGLMVSSTHSTMISTLYVKSSFVPDVVGASKRRSEEVRVASLYNNRSSGQTQPRRPAQRYALESGAEVLFQPVTFKFSKPLIYEPISNQMSGNRVVYIQVAVKQKYTHRTFKIADLTLPLDVAVTKIVREAFPLKLCTQTNLPENMMILPNVENCMTTASDPNLRFPGTPLSSPKSVTRPASDINLREVLSVSSHSPSVSIDIPFEEELETRNQYLSQLEMVGTLPESSEVTCIVSIPGAINEGSLEDENQLTSVHVEPPSSRANHSSPKDTAVTITVTNDDSDSDNQTTKTLPRTTKLSTLLGRHSTDEVILLESGQRAAESGQRAAESGQRAAESGTTNAAFKDSVTHFNESYNILLKKHKLKPKIPQPQISTNPPILSPPSNLHSLSSSLTKSDVIVSLGDLELEEFDEPTRVHKPRKKGPDEHIV